MIKVSIIMPVYNCEDYLQESIESVMRQTLQEWELLCIDDGSEDGSLELIKKYSQTDARIKYYSQKNQGAGIARNLGISHAKGEFLAFLDADDFYLDADALQCMYEECKKNQVKACGTNLYILRNEKITEDIIFRNVQEAAVERAVLRYEEFQFDYGYTCFIFESEIIKKNGIVFPPYSRFQDPPFFVKAMYSIDKFCFIEKKLYCYRAPNAAMRFTEKKLSGLLNGLRDNFVFAREYKLQLLLEKTLKRLDEEYADIIYHNLGEKSIHNLKLLMELNKIISEVKGKDYIAMPIQRLLQSVAKAELAQKNVFRNKIQGKKAIYVYGAGKRTQDFICYLKKENLFSKLAGILVTQKENNPNNIEGISVKAIDDYSYLEGDIIIVATSGIHYKDVVRCLKKQKVEAYEWLDDIVLEDK